MIVLCKKVSVGVTYDLTLLTPLNTLFLFFSLLTLAWPTYAPFFQQVNLWIMNAMNMNCRKVSSSTKVGVCVCVCVYSSVLQWNHVSVWPTKYADVIADAGPFKVDCLMTGWPIDSCCTSVTLLYSSVVTALCTLSVSRYYFLLDSNELLCACEWLCRRVRCR